VNLVRRLALSAVPIALCATVGSVDAVRAADPACAASADAPRGWIVELYTSEGCSSCPPADRWLSAAVPAAIALAFHVDYWNSLGWADRFSSPAYTDRQREMSRRSGARTIYTPQVVADGRELAPGAPRGLPPPRTTGPAEARVVAHQSWTAEGALRVDGSATVPPSLAPRALVWVALVQHGLVTRVERGENGGRTLEHDHVVRALAGPFRASADGTAAIDARLSPPADLVRARADLVVFAEDLRDGHTLQAVRLPVCGAGG
jgi:hypothetical protein